jgi:hypothetical protein
MASRKIGIAVSLVQHLTSSDSRTCGGLALHMDGYGVTQAQVHSNRNRAFFGQVFSARGVRRKRRFGGVFAWVSEPPVEY